jgi:hypothetical protein
MVSMNRIVYLLLTLMINQGLGGRSEYAQPLTVARPNQVTEMKYIELKWKTILITFSIMNSDDKNSFPIPKLNISLLNFTSGRHLRIQLASSIPHYNDNSATSF